MEYLLKISKHQAEVISLALDVLSRIGLGQFDIAISDAMKERFWGMEGKDFNRDEVQHHFNELKRILTGHPPNGSYGISNEEVNDKYRVAYDIHQVIRNRLAWDEKPEGDPIKISFQDPMQWSKEHLPTIQNLKKV